MSKRKPSRRPRQPFVKSEVQQAPSAAHTGHTRRNVLLTLGLAGGALAAWRFGLKDALDHNGPAPAGSSEVGRLAESFEQWASRIELPQIALDANPLPWSESDRHRFFSREGKYGEALKEFGPLFEREKQALIDEMKALSSPAERTRRMNVFLARLGEFFLKSTGLREPNPGAAHVIRAMNNFAVAHGYWVTPLLDSDGVQRIQIYPIKDFFALRTRTSKKQENATPFFYLENPTVISSHSAQDGPVTFSPAVYVQEGPYIMADRAHVQERTGEWYRRKVTEFCLNNGITPPAIDYARVSADDFQNTVTHEGMHSFFDRVLGVTQTLKSIPSKGDIDMGSYALPERFYSRFSAGALNEFAGVAFGLMHSGESGFIYAGDTIGSTLGLGGADYRMAAEMIGMELLHSSFVDPGLKKQINADPSDLVLKRKAILQIPNTEWHAIGERLSKLSIHLTRP